MRVDIGGGVRLHVEVLSESGASPGERRFLLALHGGPGLDHTVLRPGIDVLCDSFQLVLVDQRGHGRSARDEPARWNLDTWADDVARLCDALEAESPIVLGVSFGGTVALHFGARHPGRAAGIVCVSGSARRDRPASVRAFERIAGREVAAVAERHWASPTAETLVEFRDRCMPHYTTTGGETVPSTAVRNQELMLHWFDGEDRTFDLTAELRSIRSPLLVMTGDRDPVAPVEVAEAIVAHAPTAELAVVEGTGHGVFRDRPREFQTLVESWARRHRLVTGRDDGAPAEAIR